MSAAALLAELQNAGVTVTRNGDRLHYRTRPGVSIGPFRDFITVSKPELLKELQLREQIVAAVMVDPSAFDRAEFDRLWAEWEQENQP